MIARMCGADIAIKVVAPEVWLEAANSTPALDALCVRDLRRSLRTGAVPLRRATIEKAIASARADRGEMSTADWLARFPAAVHPTGGVDAHGALAWRSPSVVAAAEAALATPRVSSHRGFNAAVLQKEIARGLHEFHITLLTPVEWRKQGKIRVKQEIADLAAANVDGLAFGEVGRALVGEEWALYIVCTWPWAQEWRASLDLPPKDLHITLAFSDDDIHNVPKNAATCGW